MKATKSLKESINFKRVLRQGKCISDDFLNIYVKKNKENINYIGICVSKKHGNSVTRNKLKRWVREAYKSLENETQKGYNIIFLFKKNIIVQNLSYLTIKDQIIDLFKKSELFVSEK